MYSESQSPYRDLQWFLFSHEVASDSFAIPWPGALQTLLSVGCPRQEYWSGLLFPTTGDRDDLGIELESPALAGRFFNTELPGKPILI